MDTSRMLFLRFICSRIVIQLFIRIDKKTVIRIAIRAVFYLNRHLIKYVFRQAFIRLPIRLYIYKDV